MRTLTFWIVVLAAAVLQAAQSGTTQETTVRGQIVSADEPPAGIARVRITLGGAGVRTPTFVLSDERGQFQLTAPRTASLTFAKAGFLPVTVSVSAAARTPNSSLTVTLARAGVVSGRILDNEGQPVIGGGVRIWRSDSSPGTGGRSVMTIFSNDLGEFRIGRLTAGKYEISSYHDFDEQERLRMNDEMRDLVRVGVATRVLGEAQALSGIMPVDVAAGEETQITLRQTTKRPNSTFDSHGSLSGTIVDESGDPVEGVRVRAWRRSINPATPSRQTGAAATTDDRGQFRLFHLPPGQYVVEAISTTQQPSGTATGPVYYPGTNIIGLASLVPLEGGQSVGNLTILYFPSPLPGVHGVALNSAAQPLQGIVGLMATTSLNGVRIGARTQPTSDGTFSFDNVPPGEYVVRATSLRADDPRSQVIMMPSEFGLQRIVVSEMNVGPVRVVTAPTAKIAGRIEFEGSPSPAPTPADFAIRATSADPERTPDRSLPFATLTGSLNSDWTFEIRGLTGLTSIRLAQAPIGWWLKAIRTPATQSPNEPLNVITDASIVLVMSNQSGRVVGRVIENAEAPRPPTVILFSTDEREWRAGSPYVRTARTSEQRAFALNTVAPGEYYLAAVADPELVLEDDEMTTVLDALARVARRVKLNDRDEQRYELPPVLLRR